MGTLWDSGCEDGQDFLLAWSRIESAQFHPQGFAGDLPLQVAGDGMGSRLSVIIKCPERADCSVSSDSIVLEEIPARSAKYSVVSDCRAPIPIQHLMHNSESRL